MALLGADPDLFVERVGQYWEIQGIEIDPDDADPRINGIYGTTDEGLNLRVSVNRRTGMALLVGTEPCGPRA